jgi:spore coat protein U-like protein
MKRRIAVLLVFGMLPGADLYAQQPPQTAERATFKVSARVDAVCEIIASDLNLDNPTALSTGPLLGTTSLRATCTPNQTYNVGLSQGASSGTHTHTVTGLGTGLAQDHEVQGTVAAAQATPAKERGLPITVRIYY